MSPRGSREDVSNSARHCFCHTNLCARFSVVGRVLTLTSNEGDDVATAPPELRWLQSPLVALLALHTASQPRSDARVIEQQSGRT
jgi:hypothetical protein